MRPEDLGPLQLHRRRGWAMPSGWANFEELVIGHKPKALVCLGPFCFSLFLFCQKRPQNQVTPGKILRSFLEILRRVLRSFLEGRAGRALILHLNWGKNELTHDEHSFLG